MRNGKRIGTLLLILLSVSLLLIGAAAETAEKESAPLVPPARDPAAIYIESVECKESGRVEVEFYGRVQYKKPAVAVTGEDGASLQTKIRKRKKDEIDFSVSGLVPGKSYTFTISGIRPRGGQYTSVQGTFIAPNPALPRIDSVDYEGNGLVELEFEKRVSFRNPSVLLKDASGATLSATVVRTGKDDIRFVSSGIRPFQKYSFEISGVSVYRKQQFVTVAGSFFAYDD